MEYVTKRNTTRSCADVSITIEDDDADFNHSISLNSTTRSLPGASNDYDTMMELKLKIDSLTIELTSAHAEIDNLNCENTKLKTELLQCRRSIENYKKVGLSDIVTPVSSKAKSSKRKNTKTKQNKLSEEKQSVHNKKLVFENTDQIENLNKNENQIKSNCNITETIQNSTLTCITQTEKSNTTECFINDMSNSQSGPSQIKTSKNKVLIFTDDEGKGMYKVLQTLLGDQYLVTSVTMPGAKINNILSTCLKDCVGLTKSDYVIIIGGSNDQHPNSLYSHLYFYIDKLSYTNVILTEVRYNAGLNVQKLNSMYTHLAAQFKWVTFTKYSQNVYRGRYRLINLGQNILRDILRLKYKYNYEEYCKNIISFRKKTIGTQTSNCSLSHETIDIGTQTEDISTDKFFLK